MTPPKTWRWKHLPELEIRAQAGDTEAQVVIGHLLLKRHRTPNEQPDDAVRAVMWLRRAVEKGNSDAQLYLGHCYKNGWGITQNLAEALNLYRISADQGHPSAPISLGRCYEHGVGAREDLTEAAKWYQIAAERGEIGEYVLREFHKIHKDVPLLVPDDKNPHLREDEHDLHVRASSQANLGSHYEFGVSLGGFPKDLSEAIRLYRLAAEEGDGYAQYRLGQMYAEGKGVKQDLNEAVKWNDKAAAQGMKEALEFQGWLFEVAQRNKPSVVQQVGTQDQPNYESGQSPTAVQKNLPASASNTEKKKLTLGRCLAAGVWATILCVGGFEISNLALLVAFPLSGLPWLLFEMNDKSASGHSLSAIEGMMTLIAGAFISLFCAIPVVAVFVFLKGFLRQTCAKCRFLNM